MTTQRELQMSCPYTIEPHTNRTEWLSARKRGIGASEAAAILGFSRYRTAYSVAVDKLTEGVDLNMSPEAKAGILHEPTVAKWFAQEMGYQICD